MESSLSAAVDAASPAFSNASLSDAKSAADLAALQSLQTPSLGSDSVHVGFEDLYKSLTVAGRKIIDSLNELLKEQLPGGIQSLQPADVTPEATADRIVSAVTAMFSSFREQHAEMSDEEALNRFMELARGGVEKGYGDAFEILEGLGAFEYEGVQEGVEQTKKLIDQKLADFEKTAREALGIDAAVEKTASDTVAAGLLAQGGASTLHIAA